MKSTSDIKPNYYTFERYPLGGYILWLRENFREITEPDEMGESRTSWVYDEYTMLIPQALSNDFIEQYFDEYLAEARAKEASNIDSRLTAAESAITDIAKMLEEILNG